MRQKAYRKFSDDLDSVLEHYLGQARVVVIWRRDFDSQARWFYLSRLCLADYDRSLSMVELVQSRFGGGYYRAKIYGNWSRELRREEYLEQVSFGVGGPTTSETRELVQAALARPPRSRRR